MAKQLKGESLTADLTLTPAIAANLDCINFAGVPQNNRASEIVYVKNVGREMLTISEIMHPDTPFSWEAFDLPLTLNPGKKISFVVTVTPESMGEYSSSLKIKSNDPDNQLISIELNALIIEPEDEFAEKRAEMQKRVAKEIEDNAVVPEKEEGFSDWVTPINVNRESQAKYYMLAFLLLVLLAGAIFYKYRTTTVATPLQNLLNSLPRPQNQTHESKNI